MSVVIDANVVMALVSDGGSSVAARLWMDRWLAAAEDLHAPQLMVYELASAMAREEAAHRRSPSATDELWPLVADIQVSLHQPSSGAALVAIARRLNRRSAYDAAYLDLALTLHAELWTLDVALARNGESLGFPVRLMV